MIDLFTREKAVTFTGHRYVAYEKLPSIKERLKNTIKDLYSKGYKKYYCGMAMGFDLLAAEVVLSMREEYTDLSLIAVLPFRSQSERFSANNKKRYNSISSRADKVVLLNEEYYQGCLLKRNDYMLARSNYVIAYLDKVDKGGTLYTCNRAKFKGIPVKNVF